MIQFIGDAGVYIPAEDAIKFTAVDNDEPVSFFATRACLVAVGARPFWDPERLLGYFEQHRLIFHLSAILADRPVGADKVRLDPGHVRTQHRRAISAA